jgi:predicted  nucleic acid-binding Zn-ribbon protein
MKDFTLNIGNIIWIIGIIFTMGIAYSQIAQLSDDIEVIEARLEKKIKLINDCQDRIVDLEKDLIRLEQTQCKHKR